MQELEKDLHAEASAMGCKAFAVADCETLRDRYAEALDLVTGPFARAVVVGMRLQRAVLTDVEDAPTPLYFHHYRQLNYQLDRLALRLADILQDHGYEGLAIPASQIIRRDPMRGHVSHRLLGWWGGIGFLGRNNLLVHPVYGAQMRYVSVLTDAPLAAGVPHEGSCGTCMACLKACPAGAIGESSEAFDLDACYGKLCEFVRLRFVGQHICGVCVRACAGGACHG